GNCSISSGARYSRTTAARPLAPATSGLPADQLEELCRVAEGEVAARGLLPHRHFGLQHRRAAGAVELAQDDVGVDPLAGVDGEHVGLLQGHLGPRAGLLVVAVGGTEVVPALQAGEAEPVGAD